MNKLEGQYAPTPMQSVMGDPLRSEQRTGEILPRILSRVDMLVIVHRHRHLSYPMHLLYKQLRARVLLPIFIG